MAQWALYGNLGPSSQLTCICSTPPCCFTSRQFDFLGPLRPSWGCKAWLTATAISYALVLACLFSRCVLSSSWVWSQLCNALPCSSAGKESTCNARDSSSIPGSGSSPGKGHDNPLQHSCLENPHGQRSLASYSPWGHKQSDLTTTKQSTAHLIPQGPHLGAGTWAFVSQSVTFGVSA